MAEFDLKTVALSFDPHAVERLVARIKPLLAGHNPAVQGAALGNLLAIWLSGHIVKGNQEETDKLRGDLLEAHIENVAMYMNAAIEGLIAPEKLH